MLTTTPIACAAAFAAADMAAAQAPPDPPVLVVEWDGKPATLEPGATGEASLLGDLVLVPGDRFERTARIRSGAGERGTLAITLTGGHEVPPGAGNPDLATAVHLDWQVGDHSGAATFAEVIDHGEAHLATVPVAPGQTVPVTIAVHFPEHHEQHSRAGRNSTRIDFTIRATLLTDEAPSPEPGEVVRRDALPATGAGLIAALTATALLAIGTATTARGKKTEWVSMQLPMCWSGNRKAECHHRPVRSRFAWSEGYSARNHLTALALAWIAF